MGAVECIGCTYGRALYSAPGLWFLINMMWFVLLSILLMKYMDHLIRLTLNARSIRKIMNLRIKLKEFAAYIKTKTLISGDTIASVTARIGRAYGRMR